MPRPRKSPLVGKSVTFPFQISVACWIDLLGYGSMIAEANFDPLHPKAKNALSRLRVFHELVAKHSARHFPTLVINDGAVAYRDLSLRARSSSYEFLSRAWELFHEIKTSEAKAGFPGPRAVLATGFRMRGRRPGIDARSSHFRSILGRYKDRKIDAEQAIHEAASSSPTFDIVPLLQANFAFTKAYVAEQSGSGGGLPGANFYLDLSLLRDRDVDWLDLGPTVNWRKESLNLQADFAAIKAILPGDHPEDAPAGILGGLEVGQRLTDNPDLLTALRAASKQ